METAEFEKLAIPIALVVDDDPLILMDTADMIAGEGYAVVEAKTADQPYDFLDRHSSLQLLFTDVQMPGKRDPTRATCISPLQTQHTDQG